MGRSVAYATHAAAVIYLDVNEVVDWDDFETFVIDPLRTVLTKVAPSLEEPRPHQWPEREVRKILQNGHIWIGLSEYCGLASVSVVIHDDTEHRPLSEEWVARMLPKIEAAIGKAFEGQVLRKLGSFSNGEGVYRRVG